jgi:hypothetical protein
VIGWSRSIRTPDRQKAGSTNWRSQFDRPQADPEGVRRAAPNNPLCGTNKNNKNQTHK